MTIAIAMIEAIVGDTGQGLDPEPLSEGVADPPRTDPCLPGGSDHKFPPPLEKPCIRFQPEAHQPMRRN